MRNSFRGVSDIQYSCCCNRARVYIGLSVRISVTVSVPCNKICVVVVFWKRSGCMMTGLVNSLYLLVFYKLILSFVVCYCRE